MSNHAPAASSLYSGIFSSAGATSAVQDDPGRPHQEHKDGGQASEESAAVAEPTSKDNDEPLSAGPSKPQAWSAALRFAPRKNVGTNKPKRAGVPSVTSTLASSTSTNNFQSEKTSSSQAEEVEKTAASAGSVQDPAVVSNSQSPFVKASSRGSAFARELLDDAEHATAQQSSSFSGPSTLNRSVSDVQIQALQVEESPQDLQHLSRVLEPPELSLSLDILDADRRLFSELAERRGEKVVSRPRGREDYSDEDVNGFAETAEGQKARKKKRRRRNSPGHHGGLVATLNMDADYDVGVPNDYADFKNLVRRRREAVKRMNKETNVEAPLRYSLRNYNEEVGQAAGGYSSSEDGSYGRQSKMSRFAPPALYRKQDQPPNTTLVEDADDEKPYLSLTPPADEDRPPEEVISGLPPGRHPGPPPHRPPQSSSSKVDETGEDAYRRRLAMSQGSTGEDTYQPRLGMSQQTSLSTARDRECQSGSAEPGIYDPNDLAARAAAAAAIAARLSKSQKDHKNPSDWRSSHGHVPTQSDPSTFAERLMEKQGWRQGEALGAEGNKGMLDPILAEKVDRERNKQRSKNPSSHASQSAAPASGPRGSIISTHEEARRREERARYGEPSEVILLENIIGGDHEIDDDLPSEIGDECAKHGYVERVFIWSARKAAEHGHVGLGPRVFVKFSGMAGAWRCVKELDGRFFGGRTVEARYYPPGDFARGSYGKRVS